MNGGPYYSVRNTPRYQHYKNRNPPWVKLYQEFLSDPDLGTVSDGAKFFFAASVLLASRHENKIRLDGYWLWRQTGAESPGKVLGYVAELKTIGAIEVSGDASNMLATCYQVASAERETDKSRGINNHVEPKGSQAAGAAMCVFEFWKWWTEKTTARFTSDRRTKVNARIGEGYKALDFVRAIIGCCDNPFNRGENERHREFVDLELICRSGSKLEGFLGGVEEHIAHQAIARFGTEGPAEAARGLAALSQPREHAPN